jgi:hypothetical protein
MLKQYIWNILIAFDQFWNAVLGGNPRETISARADKAMLAGKKWGCILCKFLSKIQKDHCQKAVNGG